MDNDDRFNKLHRIARADKNKNYINLLYLNRSTND